MSAPFPVFSYLRTCLSILPKFASSLLRTHSGFACFFHKEEEPAWKIRRAKQQAKLKAKEDKKATTDAAASGAADNGVDKDDPDTAYWGELLEDAKKEDAGEGAEMGEKVGGEVDGGGGEGDSGSSEAAQKKAKKKKNKKKRGQQWNKKATNLWVYVQGMRARGVLSRAFAFCRRVRGVVRRLFLIWLAAPCWWFRVASD